MSAGVWILSHEAADRTPKMTTMEAALTLPQGHLAGPPAHRMPPPPPRVEWHVGDRKVNGPPSRLSSKELLRQVTEAERLLQKLQDEQSSSERKLDRAKTLHGLEPVRARDVLVRQGVDGGGAAPHGIRGQQGSEADSEQGRPPARFLQSDP